MNIKIENEFRLFSFLIFQRRHFLFYDVMIAATVKKQVFCV